MGDGTIQGGGINYLQGTYALVGDRIHIHIGCMTEIYDMTGWEDRMLAALNDATICDVDYYGKSMRIYYDSNRKYMEWVRQDD